MWSNTTLITLINHLLQLKIVLKYYIIPIDVHDSYSTYYSCLII
jgi:hypothetical protein